MGGTEETRRNKTNQNRATDKHRGTAGARLAGGRGVGVSWRRLLRNVDSAHNKKIRHKKWQKYQQQKKKKNMDDNTETLSKMANELANSKCTLRKKNEAEMKANKAKEKNVEYWQESLC